MKVTFAKINRSAEVREEETLLDVARRAGAPVGNSCGAVGICGRCVLTIIDGAAALSPRTAHEERLRCGGKLGADERLACQAVVRGDCVVVAAYW